MKPFRLTCSSRQSAGRRHRSSCGAPSPWSSAVAPHEALQSQTQHQPSSQSIKHDLQAAYKNQYLFRVARLGSQEKKLCFKLCLSLMSFFSTIHLKRLIAVYKKTFNAVICEREKYIIGQNDVKLHNI